jgi:hypothetical protein
MVDSSQASARRSRRWGRLPSPALVVAALALLVALGGTGYAVVGVPKNSVGTAQLRSGAVTSAKVRNGSLRTLDLTAAARRALTGRSGPRGPQGPQGPQGAPGLSGVELVQAGSLFNSSPERTLTVDCPAGKRLVGGGAGAWGRAMIAIPRGVVLTASHPFDEDTWLAAAQEVEPTEVEWFVRAVAICAAAS